MKRLDGLKILIAEDEPFMRGVLEKTLLSEGAWVAPCFDGVDAMATADSALIVDIVLLDFMMPRMHGLYLLKRIRVGRTGLRPDIPVGLLTGAQDKRTVTLSISLDCDAFIVKPVNREQLVERVERLRGRIGRKLGDMKSYEAIDVGQPDDIDSIPDPTAPPQSSTTASPDTPDRLTVDKLIPGMVLAENLISEQGDLIVPAGSALTETLLLLLRDLQAVRPLRPVAVRT